jgi:hypothetical protein
MKRRTAAELNASPIAEYGRFSRIRRRFTVGSIARCGAAFDSFRHDRYDLIGAAFCWPGSLWIMRRGKRLDD